MRESGHRCVRFQFCVLGRLSPCLWSAKVTVTRQEIEMTVRPDPRPEPMWLQGFSSEKVSAASPCRTVQGGSRSCPLAAECFLETFCRAIQIPFAARQITQNPANPAQFFGRNVLVGQPLSRPASQTVGMKNPDNLEGSAPDFDRLTGLDSRALVAGVIGELRHYLGTEPPAALEAEILRRLLVFFTLHSGWRARILRAPAPDFIKIFLRRWASELLFHRCRALYDALPASYRTGGPLPPLRELPSRPASHPELTASSALSGRDGWAQITLTE